MSRNAIPVILGLGVIAGGLYFIAKETKAASLCREIVPDIFHYFTYVGSSKTFKKALGECYPVIYTIDVYDPETDDYWPPADPVHDILERNSKCRVKVQAPCRLCGFVR